jgi:hypothetical protein
MGARREEGQGPVSEESLKAEAGSLLSGARDTEDISLGLRSSGRMAAWDAVDRSEETVDRLRERAD